VEEHSLSDAGSSSVLEEFVKTSPHTTQSDILLIFPSPSYVLATEKQMLERCCLETQTNAFVHNRMTALLKPVNLVCR